MSNSPLLPKPIAAVVEELARLPTIGRKSALRLALHLLKADPAAVQRLGTAICSLREAVRLCQRCGFLSESELCALCQDEHRDHALVVVVEDIGDVLALERASVHRGVYHVLHGHLSPLQGILPDDLNISSLVARVRESSPTRVREIIAATNPTPDGDATALYLSSMMEEYGIPVTRLAYGISNNSAVESADDTTLARALSGRTPLNPSHT